MPLLSSVCLWKYPLSLHLSVGYGLLGHFRDHAQCCSCSLSLVLVTSVGVVLWHHSLRLCCANPTAHTISDMAVGLNPDSNLGLSDLRRLTNEIELRPIHTAGLNPGCMNQEVKKNSNKLKLELNLSEFISSTQILLSKHLFLLDYYFL